MKTNRSIEPLQQWKDANAYDLYVGRWSKLISADFIEWLDPRPNAKWLEIGCGTGALTSEIVAHRSPSHLLAVDTSEIYLTEARKLINSAQVSFLNADLTIVEIPDEFDEITSGLVLNFIPGIEQMLFKTLNNLKKGGRISAFVWDYAGHYQPMRHFWNAARDVHEHADKFDAGIKYKLCRKENIISLFESLKLSHVKISNIESIATYVDFEDYWLPIKSAQVSVAEFLATLTSNEIMMLGDHLRSRLPISSNGEIKLIISALAIEGTKL